MIVASVLFALDVVMLCLLTVTPDTELDAPTNLLAQEETESSFRVYWDPTRAEIDGYMLTYSSSDGLSEEIPVGSDSTSYMLTGLRPGVLYTVYVWAVKGSRVSRKISTQAETGLRSTTFCSQPNLTDWKESPFPLFVMRNPDNDDGYIEREVGEE